MSLETYRASRVRPIRARVIVRQSEKPYQSPEQQGNYSPSPDFSDLRVRFSS